MQGQELDERCCGTGTCIVDAQGRCWCGQQWDGMTMCYPASGNAASSSAALPAQSKQEADAE